MSTQLWLFLVSILCSLVAIFAVIIVAKQGQKNYGEGYADGHQKGEEEEYNKIYNKRLLRQARRLSREEKKNEPSNSEVGVGELQGNPVTSNRELFGGSGIVRSDDVDAGAGEMSPTEG